MLLPIIMIVVCVLLGGGTLLFLKFSEKRKKAKGRDKEERHGAGVPENISHQYGAVQQE